MYFIILEVILILFFLIIYLFLLGKVRNQFGIRKLVTVHSPRTGEIIVWEKKNGERLLTTNGFSQGISVGKNSLSNTYWGYQVEQILKKTTRRKNPSVLWLGLGAGTGTILLSHKNPKINQVIVEFDPQIIQIAKEFFFLTESSHVAITEADAYQEVQKLRKSNQRFDAISVDIYTNDAPHNGMRSTEDDFLRTIFSLLKPEGIILFNRLAHKKKEKARTGKFQRVLKQYASTVHKKFIQDPRGYKNEILIAKK